MKLNLLLFLSAFALLTSCNGQSTYQRANAEAYPKGDTVQELGRSITVVYQDKKNIYWFGSWETGVYRYDGATLVNYTPKHGLPHNRIDEIKEDKAGNLYFVTCHPTSTVTRFDGNTFSVLTAKPGTDWKRHPDDLWFRHSFQKEMVYRFDGTTLYELTLPKPPRLSNRFEIYSIYPDRKGNIWFGTNPVGVCRYNGSSFDWITEEDVTEFRAGGANGVRSIAEDAQGDFWFNTENRYRMYDSLPVHGTPFYQRLKSIGSLDGNKDGSLSEYLSIVKDNDHTLWMATYRNGVWKYDGAKVTHFPVRQNAQDITVFSIYKDNTGNLWLGTHENGVFRFSGTAFEKFKR